jgi:hypothetical protein
MRNEIPQEPAVCLELYDCLTGPSSAGVSAAREAGSVLSAGLMAGVADVALAVAGFVAVEVVEGLGSTFGERAVITVVRVETVIDVSVKPVRTVEPGTGAEKDPPDEPVRAVVAIGSAIVWRVIEVAVRTNRGRPKVDSH